MALVIDKETHEVAPVTAFLDVEQFTKDIALVNDAALGKKWAVAGAAVALLRNYDPFGARPASG